MHEYLTVKEAADLLRVTPITLRSAIRNGRFLPHVHYFFRHTGGKRPRILFKRSALISWLEKGEEIGGNQKPLGIRMARGYNLHNGL